MRFDRAVGHDRAQLYGLVADALGRRVLAKQGGDHVGDDANFDPVLIAVRFQPLIEQTIIERGDRTAAFRPLSRPES